MGWTGSARHWHHYEKAYVVFTGLPRCCVHRQFNRRSGFLHRADRGLARNDFPALLRRWCRVLRLPHDARVVDSAAEILRLENIITKSHIDKVAKLVFVSGLMIDYIYMMEFLSRGIAAIRMNAGFSAIAFSATPYFSLGWILIGVNVGFHQLLWVKKVFSNLLLLFIIGVLINCGMWTERFVIVVGSLYQEFLPANWGKYLPTLGHRALNRHARRIFHAVSAVREISADDCHFRS